MIAGHGQASLFSPPWTVEEMVACFVVKDNAGQALAYGYFCGKGAHQGRTPRIATNMAKLPELLELSATC